MITRSYIEAEFMKKFSKTKVHFDSWKENVLPEIDKNLFWEELNTGDGSEFKPQGDKPPKFHSITSSAALVVNSFAIWKKDNYIKDLLINNLNNFNTIEFERKFKNGLGGNNPNLDVVLENNDNILAIESKFLEPLKKKSGNFAESYFNTEDHRSNSKWYNLMKKINNNQINFNYLDAVQLLKHFYGICYEKNNKNKVLFYLYWEPEHLKNKSPYDVHRQEINKFSNFVKNDELLEFEVMTYQELWDYWKKDTNNKKLIGYIENLEKRYNISLSD